ncbi:PAAR domain-containing protein [Streptomyces sp. NPDC056149]|uniref:PAAR domain-containing protein n=1 Tax=unclassified Streptomyces TaxID=2593676 RepID=UPI0023814E40|nr:PAAR domain-containing protein [Streptomyces sp. WZ-12]
MPAAARIGDPTAHGAAAGVVTGPPMAANVLIGGQPAAVAGALATCLGPVHIPPIPPVPVVAVRKVLIGGMPAAAMGDTLGCGGMIVAGCPTVVISG